MGILQSGVELYDGFSPVLNNIINALNLTVSAFGDMQRISGNDVDTRSLDGAWEAANKATMAMQALNDAYSQIGGGEVPAPVEVPVVWQTDQMPVFTGTGIERFRQEVQIATDLMSDLNHAQLQINAQAMAAEILPPNAAADLNRIQNRMQAIQARISQIANNPINMGSEQANNELEQLRMQLGQALTAQEALNRAVTDMDVGAANDAYNRLSQIVGGTERYIRDNVDEQGRFNNAIHQGVSAADSLSNAIRNAVAGFVGLAGMRKAFGVIQESAGLFDTQLNAEIQLSTVLGNMLEEDVDGAFDTITAKASEIQGIGIYGDEAMIAGAAELATYFSDPDALLSMMDTLADYSMGMSGGGALDSKAITDYATGIGKIMSGSYDAMTKKGFEFTDAQKAVIEGTATQAQIIEAVGEEYLDASADMQAAAAINAVVSESWDGLYEAMSNTPQGKIIQLSNAYGDLKEQVGAGVYPYILKIVDAINENWGTIEVVIAKVTTGLQLLIGILGMVAEGAVNVSSAMIDNWSWIGPIVYGVTAAMTAYVTVLAAYNTVQSITNGIKAAAEIRETAHAAALAMSTGQTVLATAAQYGLNAALLACPITWIILSVIAVIALIYAAVAAVNHFTGTSASATGIIAGAFAVAGAHILNTFTIPLWNGFASLANFFGNVFQNPVAAVTVLFYDMALTVIGYIKNMAAAIEAVINKIPGVTVDITSGLDSFYSGLEQAQQKVKDESGWVEYVQKMDYIDYTDAAAAGYRFGEGVEETISNFSINDLFGVEPLDMSDYLSRSGLAGNVADIANHTGSMADGLTDTGEELKYLRDIAEQETINRYTTAAITIKQTNHNNVSSGMDLDGLVTGLTDGVSEAVDKITEGTHI